MENLDKNHGSEKLHSVQVETITIENDILQIPIGLCSQKEIFSEFFSLETLNNLSEAVKEHLVENFLPESLTSPEIQHITMRELFSGGLNRFGSTPMQKLQNDLEKGTFLTRTRKQVRRKARKERRLRRFREEDHINKLIKSLKKSQILELHVKSLRSLAQDSFSDVFRRSRKRYFDEISSIFFEVGDCSELSTDEERDITRSLAAKKRKKSNCQSYMENSYLVNNTKLINTLSKKQKYTLDKISLKWNKKSFEEIVAQCNEELTTGGNSNLETVNIQGILERIFSLKSTLNQQFGESKKGRPRHLKPDNSKLSLYQTRERPYKTVDGMHSEDSKQILTSRKLKKKLTATNGSENIAKGVLLQPPEPERFSDAETNCVDTKSCLTDLDTMDIMQIPMDLNDVEHMSMLEDVNEFGDSRIPELMQDDHACFFSLIRDILCSTNDHRITMNDLRKKISMWICNSATSVNDWFSLSESWVDLIPSAMQFLTGEFEDQPEDFVPYIEYKSNLNIYQWIGAGRDSDNRLIPLCKYWLSRKNEMGLLYSRKNIEGNLDRFPLSDNTSYSISSPERSPSPPPFPRYPTSWVVKEATRDEIEDFRAQERKRYENPHMAFTYHQHGYKSVVGPVKGIYTQSPGISRARGHNMLVQNRPNFVTILTLVRDAAARLPNGEGTRTEICELLKSSQYLSPSATEQVLQTIVSGALDRMHTEIDPCVKYDTKRKIWIYLHRDRSEEEFEKLHLQQQSSTKFKNPINKKNKQKNIKHAQDTLIFTKNRVANESFLPKSSENKLLELSDVSKSDVKVFERNQKGDLTIVESPQNKIVKTTVSNITQVAKSPMGKISIVRPATKNTNDMTSNQTSKKSNLLTGNNSNIIEVSKTAVKDTFGDNNQGKRIIQISPCSSNDMMKPKTGPNMSNTNLQTILHMNKDNVKTSTGVLKLVSAIDGKPSVISNVTIQKNTAVSSTMHHKQLVQTLIAQPKAKTIQNSASILKTVTLASSSIRTSGVVSKNCISGLTSLRQASGNPKIIQVLKSSTGKLQNVSPLNINETLADSKTLLNQDQQPTTSSSKQSNNPTIVTLPKLIKNPQQVIRSQQSNKREFVINMKPTTSDPIEVSSPPVTRVLKPGISFVQKVNQSSESTNTIMKMNPSMSPLVKVLSTTNANKLVSQGVINANLVRTSAGTVISPRNQVQIPMYTVLPSNRGVVSNPPKPVTSTRPQIKTGSITANLTAINSGNASCSTNNTQLTAVPKTVTAHLQGLSGHQILNAKIVSVQTLGNKIKATPGIKMLNASNLNLSRIAGKPIIIASKADQSRLGQNIVTLSNSVLPRLDSSNIPKNSQTPLVKTVNSQRVLVATPGQSGQFVTQQIVLPSGFQGNSLNLKSLQGIKVIPFSQASDSTGNAPMLAKFLPTQSKLTKPNFPAEKDNTQN